MYENQNIIEAELFNDDSGSKRPEWEGADRSVLIARNLMFWSSAAISCGAIYFVLSAIT
ncbi:hypothetical protein KUV65_09835 [Maritalea mobilis]|uniref:hypothetical protein n=1 Tax=Maritalea mobilis TaxID=483324 RepID=UPI001C978FA0|nr:hypothetical protein [Maritalea mobilis]MBY6201662.1 hypothetical protein [Maritalea mobilis]